MTMRIGGRTDVSQMMDPVLVALHLAWAVAIAYGIASAARSSHDDCSRRRALTLATMGAALLIAGKFLLFEVGKVRHNQEMEQFFLSSGYPALLHYVVMTLEVAGSLALLVFAKRRIGIAAAVGLGLIMIGAVATHWRNGDPLSDAYDAIAQAIYIVTYLVAAVLAMHGMARTAVHSQAR